MLNVACINNSRGGVVFPGKDWEGSVCLYKRGVYPAMKSLQKDVGKPSENISNPEEVLEESVESAA